MRSEEAGKKTFGFASVAGKVKRQMTKAQYRAIKKTNLQETIGEIPPHVKIIGRLADGRRYSRFVVRNAGWFFVARGLTRILNYLLWVGLVAPEPPILEDMDKENCNDTLL